jgi:hypothetical protein
MASKTPTVSRPDDDTILAVWSGVTESDTCEVATGFSQHSDKTVQVIGDLGGGSFAFKGTALDSVDAANFATLNDNFGSPLTFSAAAIRGAHEHTPSILPVRTGGSSMNCTLVVRAKRQERD